MRKESQWQMSCSTRENSLYQSNSLRMRRLWEMNFFLINPMSFPDVDEHPFSLVDRFDFFIEEDGRFSEIDREKSRVKDDRSFWKRMISLIYLLGQPKHNQHFR